MSRGILQNDLFYCSYLGDSENDEVDIMHFPVKDPNGEGLAEYLRYLVFPEEKAGVMRSYLNQGQTFRSVELDQILVLAP